MADDFNTQGPVGELFLLVNRINAYLGEMSSDSPDDFDAANIALGAIAYLSEMLGILKTERASLYATESARKISSKGGGDVTARQRADRASFRCWHKETFLPTKSGINSPKSAPSFEIRDSAKIVWK